MNRAELLKLIETDHRRVDDDNLDEACALIVKFRDKYRLTAKSLSKFFNISYQTYYDWLNKKSRIKKVYIDYVGRKNEVFHDRDVADFLLNERKRNL